jgi:hypothetical protein|tara:strand:+ start:1359 stop:1490 length:132 start_codon:yes stop_codon:yes gene_type:complete
MITKTKFWKIIREELKYKNRADKAAEKVMKLIKEIPQNEKETA